MENIWHGGGVAYERALRAARDERIAQLKVALKQAAAADETARLKAEIRQMRTGHRERLRRAGYALF